MVNIENTSETLRKMEQANILLNSRNKNKETNDENTNFSTYLKKEQNLDKIKKQNIIQEVQNV